MNKPEIKLPPLPDNPKQNKLKYKKYKNKNVS